MNQETNDFLIENLEEAHETFKMIISEMQDNHIPFNYQVLEEQEKASFRIVSDILHKMNYSVCEYNVLREKNSELFEDEYKIYLKYFSLYLISLVFIKVFYTVFDTSKLNEMLKYVIGIFLGSTYMGLMHHDLNENKGDTREKRDVINKLKTLKEDYKKDHDQVVNEIDYIFALNTNLWNELDNNKKLVKNK